MSHGEAAHHGSTTGAARSSSLLPTHQAGVAWVAPSTSVSGARDVLRSANCGASIMTRMSSEVNPFALNDGLRWIAAQNEQRVRDAAFVLAVASARAAVRVELAPGGTQRRPTVSASLTAPHPGVFGSTPDTAAPLSSVMDCIRQHESGNYTESSHPGSGSGAYQYVPGTWRTWSARAGYPGYAYAYQAPAAVQDAVTAYTLQNGGAGNWSPRYGPDPCTVGIGG